jgi:methylenetetrahydrofolate dehydrogenase (NADP+) / methenyltetrahydrofolate cyclohydrolase
MNTFNGIKLAAERELLLKEAIARDFSNKKLKIAAILFKEDVGSQIYTKLKSEAASRVGIAYEASEYSLSDTNEEIIEKIHQLNEDSTVTGIIIQKPWRRTWVKAQDADFAQLVSQQDNPKRFERKQYGFWWGSLTSEISEKKDVDGLHPNTIAQIKTGEWQRSGKVLPATCRAVLTILDGAGELKDFLESGDSDVDKKTIIIGRSNLLGIPLYYELLRRGKDVELIASRELTNRMESGQKLLDASIVVSATGRKKLITGDMVADGVVVVDVGEPMPDVDFKSVSEKASFITPVPGGVGPMTVVSLLENCVDLAR